MHLFAIILNEPNADAWDNVEKIWPGIQHHIVNDHTALIAIPEQTLTRDIADAVGMNKEGAVLGFVIDAASRAGYSSSAVVEWMKKMS